LFENGAESKGGKKDGAPFQQASLCRVLREAASLLLTITSKPFKSQGDIEHDFTPASAHKNTALSAGKGKSRRRW
jgi:hypothetical protein